MFIHRLGRLFQTLIAVALLAAACVTPTASPTQPIPTAAPTEAQPTSGAQPTSEIQATPETQTTPEVEKDESEDKPDIESDEQGVESDSDIESGDQGRQPKVTICHNASRNNPHSITVAQPALKAHLAHGDTLGPCQVAKTPFG